MEYDQLAFEFMEKMKLLQRAKPHKHINEAVQGEAFVLHYIAYNGGDVLPGEISHEMDVSSARIAAALNALEKKGLITRRIDPKDRRKILVAVTGAGMEEAERHRQAAVGVAAKMLGMLGERDAAEYVRITGKLAEIARECN